MEFTELALKNFRRFTDARFDLSPGITLIWGKNESGKSTIHEAICCALYGRERGKLVENWNGGNCTVELTYRAEEQVYRLERRITEGIAKLGVLSGDELVQVLSTKEDIAQALSKHLGLSSRAVFENTVFIRQMCMSHPGISDMEIVGGEIQKVFTGTAHLSAADVKKRLEEKRDSVKGRARPSNPREYDKVTTRLRELAEELADARQSRDHIRNQDEELTQLDARIEHDSERKEILSQLLDRHKKWSDYINRLQELDAQHAEVFATSRKIRETLHDLADVQKELESCADLVDKDVEIADHLSKIEGRRDELNSRLSELQTVQEETRSLRTSFNSWPLITAGVVFLGIGLITGFMVDSRGFWLLLPGLALALIWAHRWASSRATESRQISDLISSAQNELTQLGAEEESILTYVNCHDADQARTRIKTYRELVARSHELEITLSTLLNGRKAKDWEAQEIDLARETSGIRAELESDFPGYAPTTEEAESWRNEFTTIQHQLPLTQARMYVVRGSLEAERRNTHDMAAIEGEIEFLHMRKQELEFIYKAYDEAISALMTVTQSVSEEYLPTLSVKAADYLSSMTAGRYTSVDIKPGWEISINAQDRSNVSPLSVSTGTLDQLYFSLRVSCGELLSAEHKLPIILDDPFASFDRERLSNVLSLITTLAKHNQVILLTHDPYVLDWAETLLTSTDVPCLVHKLPAPSTISQSPQTLS